MALNHHEWYWTLCLKKSERVIRSPVLHLHGFVFNFNFSLEVGNSNWVQIPNSFSKDLIQDGPYTVHAIAQLSVQESFSYGEMRETFERVLSPLPLCDGARQELIGHAMEEARKAFITECICDYVNIDLNFPLPLVSDHFFSSLDGFIRRSGMADSSRFQFWNKYDDDSGNVAESCCCCCICLEDVSVDAESGATTWLPCSHVFHGGCIDEWLSVANHCPLCRFELDI